MAVLTRTTVDALTTFVGVIRSGRPIVVLDLAMPAARLQTILRLADASILIVDDASIEIARQAADRSVVIKPLAELLSAEPAGHDPGRVQPGSMAAILFTSGSSGQPKGVIWSQRMLAAEALATGQRMGYREHERVAMSLPIGFAAGMAVVAVALRWGGTLLLHDPRTIGARAFMDMVIRQRATIMHTTPSMLRSLLATLPPNATIPDLRTWTACGEALYGTDIALARRHLPKDASFVQWLGSSEGCSLAFRRFTAEEPVPDGAVPCGTASRWRSIRIVGEDGATLPVGEPGDLVVTTPVLADGYWRDPERSAQKFVRRADGLWDLVTGDVGVLDDAGVLRLLGRSEAAVKIRGYLVDPSEIEAAILGSGKVLEVVVVSTDEGGITRLVAYFVPRRGSSAASVGALRGYLAEHLPLWMVPTYLVPLRELPKNERGKVDRPTLPLVPARHIEPPRGPLEEEVAGVWATILHLDQVGRNEDFLELGGDSLDVEEMLAAVEQRTGIRLLTSDFAQASRLVDFVDRLVGNYQSAEHPAWPGTVVHMKRGDGHRVVFCVAGGGSAALAFSPLANHLDPEDSVITFTGRGVERRAPAEWTFGGMVRRRTAKILALQTEGPYLVVGHSMGALLAMDIVRRLTAQGKAAVAFLIDPFFSKSALALGAPAPWRPSGADQPRRAGWTRERIVRRLKIPMLLLAGLLPASKDRASSLTFLQSTAVMRLHRPQPFDGKVYAYRTEDNQDPASLWEHLLPNAIVRDLPCTHLSILQSPFVEVIAADIEREKAGGASASADHGVGAR